MSNILDLQDESRNSEEVLRLIKNKNVRDAFNAVEATYLNALFALDEKDDIGRFRLTEAVKVVRLVQDHLVQVAESGKLATHELDQLKGKKRFFG